MYITVDVLLRVWHVNGAGKWIGAGLRMCVRWVQQQVLGVQWWGAAGACRAQWWGAVGERSVGRFGGYVCHSRHL
jgi:hypothetical protein